MMVAARVSMPVSNLFCSDLPKTIPTNKIIRVKKMPEVKEIVICFTVRLTKEQIPVQNKEEEQWRDGVYAQLTKMRNTNDLVMLNGNDPFYDKILKEDYNCSAASIFNSIKTYACIKALEEAEAPASVAAPVNALVKEQKIKKVNEVLTL